MTTIPAPNPNLRHAANLAAAAENALIDVAVLDTARDFEREYPAVTHFLVAYREAVARLLQEATVDVATHAEYTDAEFDGYLSHLPETGRGHKSKPYWARLCWLIRCFLAGQRHASLEAVLASLSRPARRTLVRAYLPR